MLEYMCIYLERKVVWINQNVSVIQEQCFFEERYGGLSFVIDMSSFHDTYCIFFFFASFFFVFLFSLWHNQIDTGDRAASARPPAGKLRRFLSECARRSACD
jgi:hypothetical protein